MKIDPRLQNKEWRINNLYSIVNKKETLVKYSRNDTQKLFNKEHHTRNIILKARQLGITTEACVDILDDVLFKQNFTAVIIAHEKDAVKKIFKKIKIAWEHFDKDLKSYVGFKENTDSANELSFTHGSSVRVALSSRSDTVNRLHISEFGKICKKYPLKAVEIITGAIPSVPEEGRIDIESTAEGEYGKFYDMFWEAHDNEPQANKEFKAFFFPWTNETKYSLKGVYDIPFKLKEYKKKHHLTQEQINWYYIESKTLKEKMTQENPITPEEAFLGSGNKLFDVDKLAEQKQNIIQGVIQGDWTYYKEFNLRHRYAIGADVAEGVGQDSSTAVVMDFTTSEVVAEYASNKIAPDLFAHELKRGGEKYGNCIIAPERNNHGFATISKLKEIYSNIFKTDISETRAIDSKAIGSMPIQKTLRYGWHTNGATKPKMLFDLNEAITEDLIKIPSKKILEELRTYDKEDLSQIRFDDEQTKHWDLVIALAICWQMRVNLKTRKETKVYTYDKEEY